MPWFVCLRLGCLQEGTTFAAAQLHPTPMSNVPQVYGHTVDAHTRCTHYHSELDIIAIKFKCCEKYFPCYKCHEGHAIERWTRADLEHERVVLCGECWSELTFAEYAAGPACMRCHARFNPGCLLHYDIYFDLSTSRSKVEE